MGLVMYTTLLIAIFVTILYHETHKNCNDLHKIHRNLTLMNILVIKDISGHILVDK